MLAHHNDLIHVLPLLYYVFEFVLYGVAFFITAVERIDKYNNNYLILYCKFNSNFLIIIL